MSGTASTWISPRAELFAEHFDLAYRGPEPGEIEFLVRRIQEGGEPALELGSGTGRVLVPLLERGLDLAGIDISPAMLDRCRAKCAERKLTVELSVQAMQDLDLSRQFGTIVMGSCGLGVLVSDDDVRRTFQGVFSHLRSRGVFSFELSTPPKSPSSTDRSGLWSGKWNRTDDGAILAMRLLYSYDPKTHVRSSIMIFERYVDGRLAATELHETAMRFWEVAEVTRYLAETGFVDIIASKVFSDDGPPGDHEWLVVRARKP